MIKFFRNIRQKLVAEAKLFNYLKYAIGELVLVVIGILIALQINIWNEQRKAIQSEIELLTSLQKEISDNIEILHANKLKNDAYKTASRELLQKLEQNQKIFSNIEISEIFNYTSSIIDSPVLDGIIASNSNVLIKNKSLIKDLRNLKNHYQGIAKSEYYLDELWNSKITNFFISGGFSLEDVSKNTKSIHLDEIAEGGYSKKQFIALINMKKVLQNSWEISQSVALKKSQEVLKILHYTLE